MTKHTNPFYAINEACAILENLGASPLRNLPPEQVDWREKILSVTVAHNYKDNLNHFAVSIHMELEGFDALLGLLPKDFNGNPQFVARKSRYTPDYDKIAIYLDKDHYMLEVMALIPREDE